MTLKEQFEYDNKSKLDELRNNKYVSNLEIYHHTIENFIKLSLAFKPFKNNGKVIFNFFLSEGRSYCNVDFSDNDYKSTLTYTYLNHLESAKEINLNDLVRLINYIHEWTLDIMIRSHKDYNTVVKIVKKYIHKDYIEDNNVLNLIKSKISINKFNL